MHGAQGHELHKGVCSDLLDLVVLETPGKNRTWSEKRELKVVFLCYGDLCPSAADCHSRSCSALILRVKEEFEQPNLPKPFSPTGSSRAQTFPCSFSVLMSSLPRLDELL